MEFVGGHKHALAIAAIVALGAVAYANATGGALLFDDASIVDNPVVHDPANFLTSLRGYAEQPNRVVALFTFSLNYWLHGREPFGYHLVNIVIHLSVACLVYLLALLLFRAPRLDGSALRHDAPLIAFGCAALFVTHPLQTEAVTYVAQRITSLAALFYLLTLVLYLRSRLSPPGWRRWTAFGGALVAALLAVHTKQTALTLPLALLLLEGALFAWPSWKRLLLLAPFAAAAALIPLPYLRLGEPMAAVLATAAEVTQVQTSMSRLDYLWTQAVVIPTYLRLLLLPVGQSADHDFPIYRSVTDPAVLVGMALLGALLAGALLLLWRSRGGRGSVDPAARVVAFGILWLFVTLSVESSLIPIADVIAERRMYLPSAGLLLALTTTAAVALRSLSCRPAPALLAGAIATSMLLASLTVARNGVWQDPVSLWSDAVAKAPDKPRAQYNLGSALADVGRHREAVVHLRRDVALDPDHLEGYTNLGASLSALGAYPEAEQALEQALRLQPEHAEAHANLGRLYLVTERYGRAAEALQAALRSRGQFPRAAANLGAALNRLGRHQEAVQLLSSQEHLTAEARFNLAVAHLATGGRAAALRELALLRNSAPQLARTLQDFLARTEGTP